MKKIILVWALVLICTAQQAKAFFAGMNNRFENARFTRKIIPFVSTNWNDVPLITPYTYRIPPLPEVYAMANLCPLTHGRVVYAARNLYNSLTNTINSFDDNCDAGSQARGTKPQTEMIRLKQPKVKPNIITKDNKLMLYPNPVETNLKIVNSNNITKVEIVNTLGIVVLQQNIGKVSAVELNVNHLQKGIYLLRAFDSNRKVLNSKFIKQ